jgi:hypothetical protein
VALRAPYVLGASVAGPSHHASGRPCEDAFAQAVVGRRVVLAVADGLGSARRSAAGARRAVDAAVELGRERMASSEPYSAAATAGEAVAAARAALEILALEEGCSIAELGCTLIVVCCDGPRVAVAHVGDGAAVARGAGGGLALLCGPSPGEYANEVTPLTSESWSGNLRLAEAEPCAAVAVFTDGCQPAALRKSSSALLPFDRFLGPLLDFAARADDAEAARRDLAELLDSPKLADSSPDDKTLAIVVLAR